jgi:hypothetical protein
VFVQDRIHWQPLGRWAGALIAAALGAVFLLVLAVGLLVTWRRTAYYPGASALPGLSGVHFTVTGLGQCLALDNQLLARASASVVGRWYTANGWDPIAPLVPRWRLGRLSLGRFVYLEPFSKYSTRIFQRQAFCLSL